MIRDHVHWYVADNCNLDCVVCFRPNIKYKASGKELEELAHVLAKNKVKKVTFTGGEPLLERKLSDIMRILKQYNIFISLHTNGTLLTERRVEELSGLVDDIALPIDSTDKKVQEELRGKAFLSVLEKIPDLAEVIKSHGMLLGYHTVFTMKNYAHMQRIYKFIDRTGFDYWRIYEFNDYLTMASLAWKKLCLNRKESEEFLERKTHILKIRGTTGWSEEDKDKLYPLLKREFGRMKRYDDPRIQFAIMVDVKEPYFFLDNRGCITTYTCLTGTNRWEIGNILCEGFKPVMKRLETVARKIDKIRPLAIQKDAFLTGQ